MKMPQKTKLAGINLKGRPWSYAARDQVAAEENV
jgi:hypothetical protein